MKFKISNQFLYIIVYSLVFLLFFTYVFYNLRHGIQRYKDTTGYILVAKSIASFGKDGAPLTLDMFSKRIPGYPVFVALFYMLKTGDVGVIIAQITLTITAAFLLSRAFSFENKFISTGLFGCVLLLPYIHNAFSTRILTESITGSLCSICFALLIRKKYIPATYLSFYIPLVRSQMIFFPIIVSFYSWWKISKRKAIIFSGISIVPLLVLSTVNYISVGSFSPSTLMEYSISQHVGHWIDKCDGTPEERAFAKAWSEKIKEIGTTIGATFRLDMAKYPTISLKKFCYMMIFKHPMDYLKSVCKSFLRYAFPIVSDLGTTMWNGMYHSILFLLFIAMSLLYIKNGIVALAFILQMCNVVIISAFEYSDNLRYRQPLEQILVFIVCYGLIMTFNKLVKFGNGKLQ